MLMRPLSLKIYGAQAENRLLVYLKAVEVFEIEPDKRVSIRALFKRAGDGGRSDGKEDLDSQKWVQVQSEGSAGPTGFMSLKGLVTAVSERSLVEVEYAKMERNEFGLVCEGRIFCTNSDQVFQ